MNAMGHHLEKDLRKTKSDPYHTIVEYSLSVEEISEETKLIIPLCVATIALGHFMANTYIRHL